MIDAATRRLVRQRANQRCEYCGLHQDHSPLAALQIEHINPNGELLQCAGAAFQRLLDYVSQKAAGLSGPGEYLACEYLIELRANQIRGNL